MMLIRKYKLMSTMMSGSAHILNSFLLFEKNIYFPLPQTELHALKSALFFGEITVVHGYHLKLCKNT